MEEKKWYVLNTKARCEKIVEIQLKNKGLEVFIPKIEIMKLYRGKKTRRIEMLFPGYLFLELTENNEILDRLNWVMGVRKVLGYGNQPATVPDGVIAALRRRVNNHYYSKPKTRFREGDGVRVNSGPFIGLIGVIESAASGKERVTILMDIINGRTKVDIEVSELEKVC